MSKENYDALLPEIVAISASDTKIPNMPVDKFLQEAADLEVWCTPDKTQLQAVGVPETIFTGLPVRIGALRFAQSNWNKDRYTKEEAAQEWALKSPVANDLRNELEHSFRFAFRTRPDLLSKVHLIEEGTGNQDLVQDLSDLAVLGNANLALLQAISFDVAKLTTAANSSAELAGLLAAMNGERNESNNSKQIRDQAYTLLKLAVDQIREAGKYVFWKDPKRVKGYKSKHWSS